VEVGKAKNTIMGKGKLVAAAYDEILFDNFSLLFNRYSFEEDQAGSNAATAARVGVRANLAGLDETLAQEIADESYAYFLASWEKRGKKMVFASRADVEGNKVFSKAKSKGKLANFINGGVWENTDKKINQITVWPSGVDIPQAGEGMNYKVGNAPYMTNYMDMKFTSFSATIDFMSFKTAKLGSTASVKSFPGLKLSGSMGCTVWLKNKVGGYIGGISADGTEEFYTEIKDEDMEFMNSKVVMNSYVIDRAKFKANVLEMLKASMDASFADYDEVVAKNSK
jgi:hypothetical protein